MRRIALVLIALCAMYADLNGQSALTFHVFPQVADGLLPDLTSYYSTLVAVNTGSKAANCMIQPHGAVASHFQPPLTMTVPASGGVAAKNTALTNSVLAPLATGYATMTCDQPVFASAGYFNVGATLPNFSLLAAATVFSSPATTKAEVVVVNTVGFRTAVAIANDTDSAAQYQITLVNDTGQTVGSTNISIPGRSNLAKFFDELFQIPPGLTGGAAIISSNASSPFSAVGLLFNGATFLSIAAAPFGQ
jgi:hypothetical protein